MIRVALIAAACTSLTGCIKDDTQQKSEPIAVEAAHKEASFEAPPVIDNTSPDKALKSYWSVVDWKKRLAAEKHKETLQSKQFKLSDETYAMVVTPEVSGNRKIYPVETFDREIIEAKVETDTRAVINAVIRNSTPIPDGADVTAYDRKRREQGNRFRYVLERSQDGWKVAEIWEFDQFYDKKWTKNSPSSEKPRVGTLTIGGY